MSIEPSTSSKCIINTSKGRIDVELWARELPNTTKIFLESCQGQKLQRFDGVRSNGTVTIVGGSPDKKLDYERHARIRGCRRGSVGYDRNVNQWFFASQECSIEDDSWILIGKIVGESNYVLRRIVGESQLDDRGKFVYPPIVNKTEVTVPHFDLGTLPQVGPNLPKEEKPRFFKRGNAKVKLSYEEEEEEEDYERDAVPLKKIKPPPGVKDKGKNDPSTKTQALKEKEPTEEISLREKETLALLSQFQQRQKGRDNILNRRP
ncbi:hypothetical protein ZYGR_0U00200 [Zygosaccharomyces rouxii]|uniref:ZYRO0F09152p n=2 Tax=Zygosaccharomyces rouxii TaxID=4956 RepID=C5DY01_ZYGRC|nr:uncharacterized protein ZYRO0F09152g [Zygosaccharomyces rouxii]KAH9199421.1 hypothetical protein LQ764DRAFT_221078 [Zygosaccharomyces rouxii]GAV50164.1 hypothetical protein ZYGR_0U00200 [Zygosaccharomyces rouxii]CAR28662.1 ZYRO0F09152p [Zygosaccharomyces rouxii]